MDSITLMRIGKLHPKIRDEVSAIIIDIETNRKVSLRVVQGLRTFAEQDDIYAQGRTKPGKIVTKAKAGQSFHNYGLALDFCLVHKDGSISWSIHEDMDADGIADWDEVQNAFSNKGYKLGEVFGDNPHIEKTFGLTWQQCLALYNLNKVDKEGYIII